MNRYISLALIFISISTRIFADDIEKYDRNSLATMMVYHEEDDFGYDISLAFDSIPLPDKFNDHNILYRYLYNSHIQDVRKMRFTSERSKRTTKYAKAMEKAKTIAENSEGNVSEDLINGGLYKDEYGKSLTFDKIEKNGLGILSVLNDAECAKLLVAKWFGFSGKDINDATFNTKLIENRGEYNATDLDIEFADKTIRGRSILADAGEELIGKTFILVNDITYVTAEERGRVAKIVVGVLLGLMGGDTGTIESMFDMIDSFTGFTVRVHSYLYQLDWNDEIANTFYNKYYTTTPNPDKIKAFLQDTALFSMKYVAHEYECDTKTTYVGEYSRNELVKTICTRALDKNIAALQKQYEPFKVKTPIYSIEETETGTIYNVKIGLKEGVTDNSRYRVVQKVVNPETFRTSYQYVATLAPINGKIWDNRYNAVSEVSDFADLPYTSFKKISGGNILPGMLIIEGY